MSASTASSDPDPGHTIFEAGDVRLQSGATLPDARLAYKTLGRLNNTRSNAVVLTTPFGAQHTDIEWMVGPGRTIDPQRYFVVLMNLFGNGLSSSPSDAGSAHAGEDWPECTIADNVRVQERLLREVLGIEQIELAFGFSMGGIQAYHWAALFPDRVRRFAAICGAARCSAHNHVFLEGVKAALTAGMQVENGRMAGAERGLRTVGRIFAGWAVSQAFYREELWRSLGCASVERYITDVWEANFLRRDARNLLAQIWTWQHADISDNDLYRKDLNRALGDIRAQGLIMPSESDLYVHTEDCRREAERVPGARFRPIPSKWGHRAGARGPGTDEDRFIEQGLRELLAS